MNCNGTIDYDDCINDKDVDGIIISSPTHAHFE